MLREDDVLGERAREARAVVRGDVVAREVVLAPRPEVVPRVLLHALEREDAFTGCREHVLIDVGRVDARAVVEAFLLEQDGERVDLLPRRAARAPDPREGIRVQERHDDVAEGDVERGVAEHGRDVDREVEQEPLHALGVVEDALLEPGDAVEPLAMDAPPEAPLERRVGVLAEVEPVPAVDRLEQDVDLDPLDVVVRGRARRLGIRYR